jgi:isoleucyl-tRNA synthetase
MYKPVSTNFKYSDLEKDILAFWKEHGIFEKSVRSDAPNFVFYEGPPTANGKPGIHHVMSRTIKDVVCRYKTLRGYKVNRKAGWDTHGLPVEIQVEKELKIQGREEILKYGLKDFNDACRASVFEHKDLWDELTTRMGYWVDLTDPYITCENDYVESVWWILSELFKKDLIYKGYKIQPYCPQCGTSLSSHEVSQGYKDVKDLTAIARFPVTGEEKTYFLAWTTTPWTLPSNMALAVGPKIEYVKVKHNDEFLILAKDLVSAVIGEDAEIIETKLGSELKGTSYDPLFNFTDTNEHSHKILLADFVTTTDGTGIVHMAPAYGEDDYKTCTENNIPVDILVQADGTFSSRAGEFAGLDIKVADPEVVTNLKHRGLLFKSQKMEHSYPHCWRHGTPLFYYAQDSWFIKTTLYRDQLMANNKAINWYPESVGEGRFGKWLENNIDWSLSRKRFWGTPLNIWLTEDESEMKTISSVAELKSEIEKAIKAGFMQAMPETIDLHKPFVDDVFLVSSKGEKMTRTPEVIDCWFDSGSMPLAQWHYPFENKDRVDSGEAFPADFICEGIDQTRGWFYTLLAISTMLFDKSPYKNVMVNNLILDKDGQKMSKSKGNTVEPHSVMERYGADTLRWFFMTSSQPWISKRFDEEAVLEVQRKFIGTLVNTYAFYVLYANVDKFDHNAPQVAIEDRPEIDRWIISHLYTKIEEITAAYDGYDLTTAGRALSDFLINDVSNWYVRRNRRRFWKGEVNADKMAAYQTLHEVLMAVIKMASPMIPFLSEDIYQNLKSENDPESVHLTDFPAVSDAQRNHINKAIETKMQLAQTVVEMARSLRSENQIKIRQPLAEISVFVEDEANHAALEQLDEIILEELNVKKLVIVDSVSELATRKARPNFKLIGPRFGKSGKLVTTRIQALSEAEITDIENGKTMTLDVDGENVTITSEFFDIVHEKKDGLVVASGEGISLALNTVLSQDLKNEGLAREFVSKLQQQRKDAGFDVVDRINVQVQASQNFADAIEKQLTYIQSEILANSITFVPELQGDINLKIENHNIVIVVNKA